MTHLELGRWGEDHAIQYLLLNNYSIIERNYRSGKLELDIIAKKDKKVIFVEVKTRVTAAIGEPYLAVTRTKQKQLIKVANAYLIKSNCTLEAQFDIISIVHNSHRTKLEHLANAFHPIV